MPRYPIISSIRPLGTALNGSAFNRECIDLRLSNNKKPTNWWGRQNAAPLKFDPKPSEAAFWTDRFLELS